MLPIEVGLPNGLTLQRRVAADDGFNDRNLLGGALRGDGPVLPDQLQTRPC
ncbi:hypothetical protein D3C73_1218880 [compost metagenome]